MFVSKMDELSNVTTMGGMFGNASSFNQPLNNWDVSNVTDMAWMFHDAHSFNQPLHAPWYHAEAGLVILI